MTKYNWDYEAMGFKSERELNDSIARVERKMKMGDVEREIERMNEAQSRGIDFTSLKEGARREELDRVVHNRILYDKEQAKAQAEQEKWSKLFKATADDVVAEKEAKAQRELQKQKQKAEAELQQDIYSKHGVKTDEQKIREEALSKMLGSFK